MFLKKTINKAPAIPHPPGRYLDTTITGRNACPQRSQQHYLQWPSHGTTQVFTDRGMDEEDMVHIYNRLLSHEKEGHDAICCYREGPRDVHSE